MYYNYLIFLIYIVVANKLASIYSKYRACGGIESPYKPLPDIIQETLPQLNTHVPDYLLLILLFYCLFFKNINYREINALFLSLSIRPLFTVITTLPTCMVKQNVSDTIYSYLFNQEFDLMFSGHTCVFIFLGKVIDNEFGMYVEFMLPITLVMARQHYSIDVLCSMFVYNYFYSQDYKLSIL
tara:strand:+ start:1034 stop:1582 length:549 start_codon:yes stop_codon:yes gene_type:complete